MIKVSNSSEQSNHSPTNSFNLSPVEQKVVQWLKIKKQCTIDEVVSEFAIDKLEATSILNELSQRDLVKTIQLEGDNIYLLKVTNLKKEKFLDKFLKNVEKKIGKIKFSRLIILTFVTAILLLPFVFSRCLTMFT